MFDKIIHRYQFIIILLLLGSIDFIGSQSSSTDDLYVSTDPTTFIPISDSTLTNSEKTSKSADDLTSTSLTPATTIETNSQPITISVSIDDKNTTSSLEQTIETSSNANINPSTAEFNTKLSDSSVSTRYSPTSTETEGSTISIYTPSSFARTPLDASESTNDFINSTTVPVTYSEPPTSSDFSNYLTSTSTSPTPNTISVYDTTATSYSTPQTIYETSGPTINFSSDSETSDTHETKSTFYTAASSGSSATDSITHTPETSFSRDATSAFSNSPADNLTMTANPTTSFTIFSSETSEQVSADYNTAKTTEFLPVTNPTKDTYSPIIESTVTLLTITSDTSITKPASIQLPFTSESNPTTSEKLPPLSTSEYSNPAASMTSPNISTLEQTSSTTQLSSETYSTTILTTSANGETSPELTSFVPNVTGETSTGETSRSTSPTSPLSPTTDLTAPTHETMSHVPISSSSYTGTQSTAGLTSTESSRTMPTATNNIVDTFSTTIETTDLTLFLTNGTPPTASFDSSSLTSKLTFPSSSETLNPSATSSPDTNPTATNIFTNLPHTLSSAENTVSHYSTIIISSPATQSIETTNASITTATTNTSATTTSSAIVTSVISPIRLPFLINGTRTGRCSKDNNEAIRELQTNLRPILVDFEIVSTNSCDISFKASYAGYADLTEDDIKNYVSESLLFIKDSVQVTKTNESASAICPLGQEIGRHGSCIYCGGNLPCSNYPESTCVTERYGQNFFCKCDRGKHFFRTNYEYDEKCYRTSTVWWPQMLALTLLIVLVLALLAAFFLFMFQRHRNSWKKLKQPEVLSNAPEKTLKLNSIQTNDSIQSSQYLKIHPIEQVSDSLYRQRVPYVSTFPRDRSTYVHRGLSAELFDEINYGLTPYNSYVDNDEIFV